MPVIPFIPLIASGVGALAGKIGGQKATAAAQQRSPEETAALTGAQSAAGNLTNTGSSLISQGQGNVNPAAGYYKTLLNGNRGAMANATAAPRAQLQEGIRGAQTDITRMGVRGAAKDVLSGNLSRQGQSQVAGLTTGVQPGAANALATIGQGQTQTGQPMLAQAGNIYGNLLGAGANNRAYARQEGGNTGNAIGKLIAGAGPVLQGAFGGNSSSPMTGATGWKPTDWQPTPASGSAGTWKPTDWQS